MRPITRYCKQSAIYWAPISVQRDGTYLHADPIELLVRWEDAAGIVVSRSQGEWRPAVKLITSIMLEEHGLIRLGTLSSLSSKDPTHTINRRETMTVGVASQVPDVRSRRVLFQAFIGRL